eukprot:COSAG01_NODE_1570_length_9869_cov_360.007267_10_plen_253_part_00
MPDIRVLLMLMLDDGDNSHYCWIKRFSAFARQPSDHNHNKQHFCRHCLQGFATEKRLKQHLHFGCREITDVIPRMPRADEAILQFKAFDKQFRSPFVIYADFECLLKPVDSKMERNADHSYTDAYNVHEPCGYCVHVACADKSLSLKCLKPIVYHGPDTIASRGRRPRITTGVPDVPRRRNRPANDIQHTQAPHPWARSSPWKLGDAHHHGCTCRNAYSPQPCYPCAKRTSPVPCHQSHRRRRAAAQRPFGY